MADGPKSFYNPHPAVLLTGFGIGLLFTAFMVGPIENWGCTKYETHWHSSYQYKNMGTKQQQIATSPARWVKKCVEGTFVRQ